MINGGFVGTTIQEMTIDVFTEHYCWASALAVCILMVVFLVGTVIANQCSFLLAISMQNQYRYYMINGGYCDIGIL